MQQKPFEIERDKLRTALRHLGSEHVFYMLDDAIDLLPPTKLHAVVKKYLDVSRLRPDADNPPARLLADVRVFERASLAGEYYESFAVNSKNCTQESSGTIAWIAQCQRSVKRDHLRSK
jgi:hypothetical protein